MRMVHCIDNKKRERMEKENVGNTGQSHENDKARTIIVCAPSAISKLIGSLHPAGALYERPLNLELACVCHDRFVSALRRRNVEVFDVREILTERVEWSLGDRIELEKLGESSLKYETSGEEIKDEEHKGRMKHLGSTEYKRSVLSGMGVEQLVEVIFGQPTVRIRWIGEDTGCIAGYEFEPLSNMVFVRDQQLTTRKGVVMGRLKSGQREREVEVMEFCLRKLGLKILGGVQKPGYLEGGDFIAAGADLCFVGIGCRSDLAGVTYVMERDWFGTRRIAVVKDVWEKRQERMHLDTVFNVVGERCCVALGEMLGEKSATRRMVDEYVQECEGGKYKLRNENVEFSRFLSGEGFDIVEVSSEEQLRYGCNVLNMGLGDVICTDRDSGRRIAESDEFKGTIEYLDFSAVSSMYGGVHCASQVVRRG